MDMQNLNIKPHFVVIGILLLASAAVFWGKNSSSQREETVQEAEKRLAADEVKLKEGRLSHLASDEFRSLGAFVDTVFAGGTRLWANGFYVNQRLSWMGGLIELNTNKFDSAGGSRTAADRKSCQFLFRSFSGRNSKESERYTLELTGGIELIDFQNPLRTQIEIALKKGGDYFTWHDCEITVKGEGQNLESLWIEGGWLEEGYILQDIDQLSDEEWDFYEEGYLRVASWIKNDIFEKGENVYVQPASYFSGPNHPWGGTYSLLVERDGEYSLVRVDGVESNSKRTIRLFEDFPGNQTSPQTWTPITKSSRRGVQYETGMGRFRSELNLSELPKREFPFEVIK